MVTHYFTHYFKGTAEIFKFGLYLMFPVSALFLFNEPGVLEWFKTPAIDAVRQGMEEEKKGLYKIPHSFKEIDEQLRIIKEAKNKSN